MHEFWIMDETYSFSFKTRMQSYIKSQSILGDEGVSIIFITHKFEDMYSWQTR